MRLRTLVDQHMLRLDLTKTMQEAARERTISLTRMVNLRDLFEHDAEVQKFYQYGASFMQARRKFLGLALSAREQALLDRQWSLIRQAMPLQNEVIDLSAANRIAQAQRLLTQQVIPAQDAVMQALSQLDDLTRATTHDALRQANLAHQTARRWIIALSSLALALGLLIAGMVVGHIHRTNLERMRMATHDALTGLPNRMLLLDRLDQALLRSRRQQTHVGLLFIDLDGFKEVNDTLGHAAGDEVLKLIAQRLQGVIRSGDIVARLGGDEFIIGVLDVARIPQISMVADKLLMAIRQPMRVAGRDVTLSGSVGICVSPQDGTDAKSLLRCADAAMYSAKQAGKDQVRRFTPDLRTATVAGS
jgi:diguanylate cyclase (GGDEF)-like protein